MKTKEGFGRLLAAGRKCELIKLTKNGSCAIRLENGNIYHGKLADLDYEIKEVVSDGGKTVDVYYL
jgi:hypothetical protein